MDIPTFEFAAGEWMQNEAADITGYPAIIRWDGEEIWRSTDPSWHQDAAIEDAKNHLVASLRRVLAWPEEEHR